MIQWKDIEEFENYMISSNGRVMNSKTNRVMKMGYRNSQGYLVINLSNKGKKLQGLFIVLWQKLLLIIQKTNLL